MSETNEPGPEVTITVDAGGEAPGGQSDGGEVAEAVESAADAAVEVARIEADRDVTVAAIEADTSLEHHQLSVEETRIATEALANSELEQCRTRIAELETANAVLTAEVERLTSPPPSLPPNPENQSAEGDGPRESPVVEAVETVVEAEAPPEPVARKKAHRWI